MLLIKVIILISLSVIFLQDLLSRSVYWVLFPLMILLLVVLRLISHQDVAEIWEPALINASFLILQFLLVSVYFSLKNGRWINITKELLGWGDILFLLTIIFYLSVISFFLFYMISLVVILLCWVVVLFLFKEKNNKIPLAGLQALLFGVFLAGDWWYMHFNFTDDTWLLNLITK